MAKFPTNSPEFEHRRKNLRNNSTSAEAILWKHLRNRQLEGRKFRRQFGIENYILDFYCVEEKLNIELDGRHHFDAEGYEADKIRDEYLQVLGVKVLRFENKTIFEALEIVLTQIKSQFNDNKTFARGLPRQKHYLGI